MSAQASVAVRACTDARYHYRVYGFSVSSQFPLALSSSGQGHLGKVNIRSGGDTDFSAVRSIVDSTPPAGEWYRYWLLDDGASFVHWEGIGEFIVSPDGAEIVCRRFHPASIESFQVYLLGQALSFALVKQGHEPLHATAVVVDGQAIAFVGDSGMGKSTLAAAFVEAGHRVLTDDVLLLSEIDGETFAFPGPARLKLFPAVAARLLHNIGAAQPMNASTPKLILPIAGSCSNDPAPLTAIYALADPQATQGASGIRIERLSGRDAALELIKGTFNQRLVTRARLARQFTAAATLAEAVPVKSLCYPRRLIDLPDVLAAVIADATKSPSGEPCGA